jgi:hypothetical protein
MVTDSLNLLRRGVDCPVNTDASKTRTSRRTEAAIPPTLNPDAAYPVNEACLITATGRSRLYQAMSNDPAVRNGLPHLASFTVGKRRLIRGKALAAWLDALEARDAA